MKKRDLKTCYSPREVKAKALPAFVRRFSAPIKVTIQPVDLALLLYTAQTALSQAQVSLTALRKASLRAKEQCYWRSKLYESARA